MGTADSGGTGTRRTGRGVGEGGAEAAAAAAEEEEERDPTEGLEEVKQLTIAVDTRDDEPVILHPFTFSHTPFPALHSLLISHSHSHSHSLSLSLSHSLPLLSPLFLFLCPT